MAGDDIHAMSEQLAADPASLVFLPLAEALLARGDLPRAQRVAQRGASRHAGRTDAHDLVARIALAQGDEAQAEASWANVLQLEPGFGTAHRGIGLLRYRQGRLDEARDHLAYAAHQDPGDNVVRAALDAVQKVIAQRDAGASISATAAAAGSAATADSLIDDAVASAEAASSVASSRAAPAAPAAAAGEPAKRRSEATARRSEPGTHRPDPTPAPVDLPGDSPAHLFDNILEDSKQVALLIDADGLVAAGNYVTGDGRDVGSELGAHLSGVGEEAERAMRHFKLGLWVRLVIETEAATIEMAPTDRGAVLVAASREVPLGFVRRTLDRCVALARRWLKEGT